METKNRLEKILKGLESDEGRMRFAGSDYLLNFRREEIYEVVDSYSKSSPKVAAQVAKNSKLFDIAMDLYEKLGDTSNAAFCAKEAGFDDKILLYKELDQIKKF